MQQIKSNVTNSANPAASLLAVADPRAAAPKLVIAPTDAEAALLAAGEQDLVDALPLLAAGGQARPDASARSAVSVATWSVESQGLWAEDDAQGKGPERKLLPALVKLAAGKDVAVILGGDEGRRLAAALYVQSAYIACAAPDVAESDLSLDGPRDPLALAAVAFGCDTQPTPYRIMQGYESRVLDPADPFSSEVELRMRLAYPRGGKPYLPSWERETVEPGRRATKDEPATPPRVVWKPVAGAPHLWMTETIEINDAPANDADGSALITVGTGARVVYRYQGARDHERDGATFSFGLGKPITRADMVGMGFGCSSDKVFGEWCEIQKAITRDSGKVTAGTLRRGFVDVGGERQYVQATRVIARPGATKIRPVATGYDTLGFKSKGAAAEQKRVYRLLLRNTPFAALAGLNLASALLSLIPSAENAMVMLSGASSTGKTSMLQAQASMMGSNARASSKDAHINSFGATQAGLEGPATARNDCSFFLDEAAQLRFSGSALASLIYDLNHGIDKLRATRDGGQRANRHWRNIIFGSGEFALTSLITKGGGTIPGGLQFRLVEIDVATNRLWHDVEEQAPLDGYGAYASLMAGRRVANPSPVPAVIETVEAILGENHGHLWEEWIERLLDDKYVERCKAIEAQERSGFELPPEAAEVYTRRLKHLSLAMVGLHGFLDLLGLSDAEKEEVLARARIWLRDVFWCAGLGEHKGNERLHIREKVVNWLLSNPGRLHGGGGRPEKVVGWIAREGAACLTTLGRDLVAEEIGVDPLRVQDALAAKKKSAPTPEDWVIKTARPPFSGKPANALRSPDGMFRMEADTTFGTMRLVCDYRSDAEIARDEAKANTPPFTEGYVPPETVAGRTAA